MHGDVLPVHKYSPLATAQCVKSNHGPLASPSMSWGAWLNEKARVAACEHTGC